MRPLKWETATLALSQVNFPVAPEMVTEGQFSVFGALDQTCIAEGLGERDKARRSCQFVVDAWHRPDSELLPYVIEARKGLARLKSR